MRIHFSPNSDGSVSCDYQAPKGWAADMASGSNAWTGDPSEVSCGACATAMKAKSATAPAKK